MVRSTLQRRRYHRKARRFASLVSHGTCDADRSALSTVLPALGKGDRWQTQDHKSGDRGRMARLFARWRESLHHNEKALRPVGQRACFERKSGRLALSLCERNLRVGFGAEPFSADLRVCGGGCRGIGRAGALQQKVEFSGMTSNSASIQLPSQWRHHVVVPGDYNVTGKSQSESTN